jgi:uncharacterized delta-60 repeat protein
MVEGLEGRALMSTGGSPADTFGSGGFAPFPRSIVMFSEAHASAAQADGKIVVVGVNGADPLLGQVVHLTVSRYDVDGSIDTTFGTGGTFTSPLLSITYTGDPNTITAEGQGVAIQTDGKIVIAGNVGPTAKVIRLNSNGTLDPNFGTGGIVTLGTFNANDTLLDYAGSVALLPGGQIVVGGEAHTRPFGADPAVERLNLDGSVDTTYGQSGLAVIPKPADTLIISTYSDLKGSLGMVVQPDGKVVITCDVSASFLQAGTEIVTTRLDPDGTPDPTFGTGGQVSLSPSSLQSLGSSDSAGSLAIQVDGKLVIGGSITLSSPPSGTTATPQILVLRLLADGTLDPTFGVGGINVPVGDAPGSSLADAVAIQPDGKIVLADLTSASFFRLNAHGLPDTSFGTDGEASYQTVAGQAIAGSVSLAVLSGGEIVATLGGISGGLLALLGQGATGDYNHDGISDPAIYVNSQGVFAYKASGNASPGEIIPFGTPGVGLTLPAPGAYDGAGVSELAVYLPTQGEFAVRPFFGGPDVITPFGTPGVGNSIPAPGDYDLSGKTEYAVYLPSQGAFAYRPANGGADRFVPFGTPGPGKTIPAPADYFGTGQTDIAVYLPALGAYDIRFPATGRDYFVPFGVAGAGKSIPVPGDYDGSGHAELAVYLPDYAALVYRPANGGKDVVEHFGIPGAGQTLPAPGDYDGSGKTEVAAYFPKLGLFAYRPANGGKDVIFPFGTANQTIPFALASATDTSSGGFGFSARAESVSVEIPLTQDVLDSLAGTTARKPAKHV